MSNPNLRWPSRVGESSGGSRSQPMRRLTSLLGMSRRAVCRCGNIFYSVMRSIALHSLRIQLGSIIISLQRNGETGNIIFELHGVWWRAPFAIHLWRAPFATHTTSGGRLSPRTPLVLFLCKGFKCLSINIRKSVWFWWSNYFFTTPHSSLLLNPDFCYSSNGPWQTLSTDSVYE